jgi:hypothetical protein
MTQPASATLGYIDTAHGLIQLLEKHRSTLPFAEEELANHLVWQRNLDAYRLRIEQALSDWRASLAHRWECEVAAQRVYISIQRQLAAFYNNDTRYSASVPGSNALTPNDLLANLQNLERNLQRLLPQPPFIASALSELNQRATALAEAIKLTAQRESDRRSIQLEQRLTMSQYQVACSHTRQLLGDILGV